MRSNRVLAIIVLIGAGSVPMGEAAETNTVACSEFRYQAPPETSEALLRLGDDGGLRIENGPGVRLYSILYADRVPGLSDEQRVALTNNRIMAVRQIMERMTFVPCLRHKGRDRYGRHSIDALGAEDRLSLGRWLVAEGFAVVRPEPSAIPCCAALYRAEARARTGRKGIWATESELFHKVDPRTGKIHTSNSGFAIVEGWVRSVGDRERHLYLNFGRSWAIDFTVVVNKRDFADQAGNLAVLTGLAGHRVRVRGLADSWQGTRIVVRSMNQIELLTQASHP
ncbi:MAG: hypothetical protein AAGF59_13955 [Pseudomonadota bacterium]